MKKILTVLLSFMLAVNVIDCVTVSAATEDRNYRWSEEFVYACIEHRNVTEQMFSASPKELAEIFSVQALCSGVTIMFPTAFKDYGTVAVSGLTLAQLGYRYVLEFQLAEPGKEHVEQLVSQLSQNARLISVSKDYYFPAPDENEKPDGFSMLGDVDFDDQITAEDARFCLRAAVGLESVEQHSLQFAVCDMDGDAFLTSADARAILRASVGLEG